MSAWSVDIAQMNKELRQTLTAIRALDTLDDAEFTELWSGLEEQVRNEMMSRINALNVGSYGIKLKVQRLNGVQQ